MAKKMARLRVAKKKGALPKKPRNRARRKADWDESAVIHQDLHSLGS